MSSDHAWRLLRRPLPPTGSPPMVRPHAAPRPPGGPRLPLLLNQADPGMRGGNRSQEADTPVPKAAPPTPLLHDASTQLTDRVPEGFPRKLPRTQRRNPLLELLQSDTRFRAPPPSFCLSDFLQNHSGSQSGSQSPPV